MKRSLRESYTDEPTKEWPQNTRLLHSISNARNGLTGNMSKERWKIYLEY